MRQLLPGEHEKNKIHHAHPRSADITLVSNLFFSIEKSRIPGLTAS